MTKKLVLSVPDRPKGEQFAIDGLGVFTNGTHEVSDDQAKVWEQTSGFKWPRGGELHLPVTTESKPLKTVVAFDDEGEQPDPDLDLSHVVGVGTQGTITEDGK